MGTSKNKYFALILIVVSVYWLSSCQKAPAPTNPALFLKTYQTQDTTAITFYAEQMLDGGFFLVSAMGSSSLILSRTNKSGNLIWDKVILKSGFYQYYIGSLPPWILNAFNTGDAGHFLVQSGDFLVKFDSTGIISSSVNNGAINAEMIQAGPNFIGSSYTGIYGSGPSTNVIYVYDQNLNLKQTDTFLDSRLGTGKVLQFFLNGTSSGRYNILGTKYPTSNTAAKANVKLFAAAIPFPSGKVTETIVDTSNQTHSDQIIWQTTSADSDMVLLGQRTDVTSTGELVYPVVIKFDKNLNIVWEKEFPVNNSVISLSEISLCRDGGFMIVGAIASAIYGGNQLPYALKIDQKGNKQWDKTITSLTGTGSFVYGTNLADGGFALVGESSQFGKGKDANLTLFVRTDANGNY